MRLLLSYLLFLNLSFSQVSNFDKGVKSFENKEWIKAKYFFLDFLNEDATKTKAQEYLGDIEAYNKNWNSALVFYKKLIFIDDNNANYHFKYGGVLAYKAQSSNRLKAFMLVVILKSIYTKQLL
ncbi:hypothetical protein OAX11_00480 [Flavobacteriaceae bacterium]|jgi:hypothetical protein|nr:hypothetical protein [Flavobacteriaceae bacterium]